VAQPLIRAFPTEAALAEALASFLRDKIAAAGESRSPFHWVLAGGRTPLHAYSLVADRTADLDWSTVHIWWGDERFVPFDHPDSNYGAVKRDFLDRLTIPPANVHPMVRRLDSLTAAALDHEAELKRYFPDQPRFDLTLLGIGEDGHVASLFPGASALEENTAWVLPVTDSPKPPPERVTLTFPALNNSMEILFVAAGAGKASVLDAVWNHPTLGLPAQRVRPGRGSVTWWVDVAAAPAKKL
jgi:6-phosphogluconolactonase